MAKSADLNENPIFLKKIAIFANEQLFREKGNLETNFALSRTP